MFPVNFVTSSFMKNESTFPFLAAACAIKKAALVKAPLMA